MGRRSVFPRSDRVVLCLQTSSVSLSLPRFLHTYIDVRVCVCVCVRVVRWGCGPALTRVALINTAPSPLRSGHAVSTAGPRHNKLLQFSRLVLDLYSPSVLGGRELLWK